MKSYDAFRGSHSADTFTYKSIEKKVLGRHGIHLLMEREESLFFPYVVGVLCIGTHVSYEATLFNSGFFNKWFAFGEEFLLPG